MNGKPVLRAEMKTLPYSASLRFAEPELALSLWQDSTVAWQGFVPIFALAESARILSAMVLSLVQDV